MHALKWTINSARIVGQVGPYPEGLRELPKRILLSGFVLARHLVRVLCLRVRLHIIRNAARIKTVGKYQSCMAAVPRRRIARARSRM